MENVYNTSMSHVNCFCMSMSKCYVRKRGRDGEGGREKRGSVCKRSSLGLEQSSCLYKRDIKLILCDRICKKGPF